MASTSLAVANINRRTIYLAVGITIKENCLKKIEDSLKKK
jgi:hypothetical protein